MKYEYVRIELIKLLSHGYDIEWMYTAPECEYRDDYLCFFVLKGSKTHTLITMKYGDVYD